MKRTRFTAEQIIGVLKEAEAGAKAADLARQHGLCLFFERKSDLVADEIEFV